MNKIFKACIFSFIIIAAPFPIVLLLIKLNLEPEKGLIHIQQKKTNIDEGINNLAFERSITYRLLKMDFDYGLISQEKYFIAISNVRDYFESTNFKCGIYNKNPEEFLSCANKNLGDNFSYQSSIDIGSDLSSHQSDCDSNVYLIYDIAQQNGINTRIRYLPYHALLWYEGNEKKGYWETTENNNHGALADFKKPKYLFSNDPFYNTNYDDKAAIEIYPVLLLSKLPKVESDKVLSANNSVINNNPIRKEFYYWKLEYLSQTDIMDLKKLLDDTPSSVNTLLILSRHYLKSKDTKTANIYLKKINDSYCNTLCLDLRAEIDKSVLKRFLVRKITNKLGIPDNKPNQTTIQKYLNSMYFIQIILFLILLKIFILRRKLRNTQQTHPIKKM